METPFFTINDPRGFKAVAVPIGDRSALGHDADSRAGHESGNVGDRECATFGRLLGDTGTARPCGPTPASP